MTETNYANAFQTTLQFEMGPTDLIAQVQTTDGAPASPCYLVIEPENADRREYILFDGTFNANEFATSTTDNRYLGGSAQASGITHPAGSVVRFSPVAQHFTDLHNRVAANESHVGKTGSQGPHGATDTPTGHQIPIYTSSGQLSVVDAADDDHAVAKGQADSAYAAASHGSHVTLGTAADFGSQVPSTNPGDYPEGVTVALVALGGGWPSSGIVITWARVDDAAQIHVDTSTGTTRVRGGEATLWTGWTVIT